MSEETIYTRLSVIQRTLKVPKLRWNDFGKYHYRSGEDILEAVKLLLVEGECLLADDEPIMVGDWHYIKAVVSFNKNGEEIKATGFAKESDSKKGMDASQITGTASSYARKYAANALFCIDDTKDADTMDNRDQKQTMKNNSNQGNRGKYPAVRNNKQQETKDVQKRPFKEALDWLEKLQGKPPEVIEKSWLSAQVFLSNTYSADECEKLKVKYNELVSESLQK